MAVGLVIVSHSARLAEGVAELAGQMAHGKVAIAVAGGTSEGCPGDLCRENPRRAAPCRWARGYTGSARSGKRCHGNRDGG